MKRNSPERAGEGSTRFRERGYSSECVRQPKGKTPSGED